MAAACLYQQNQIVLAEDNGGAARVGFGGMRFDGIDEGLLTFLRVRDLVAGHELSPERARRMTLEPKMIAAVFMEGRLAWGRPMAGLRLCQPHRGFQLNDEPGPSGSRASAAAGGEAT